MMNKMRTICPIVVLALSACAELGSDYEPILDGQADPNFQSDLESCQNLARSQPFFEDTIGAAVAGGLFGGLIGDHESGVTAAEGAVAGALFGLIGATLEGAEHRQSIIFECMKIRGHRVVG